MHRVPADRVELVHALGHAEQAPPGHRLEVPLERVPRRLAQEVRRHRQPQLAGQHRRRHPEPARRPHASPPTAPAAVPVEIGAAPQDRQDVPGGTEPVREAVLGAVDDRVEEEALRIEGVEPVGRRQRASAPQHLGLRQSPVGRRDPGVDLDQDALERHRREVMRRRRPRVGRAAEPELEQPPAEGRAVIRARRRRRCRRWRAASTGSPLPREPGARAPSPSAGRRARRSSGGRPPPAGARRAGPARGSPRAPPPPAALSVKNAGAQRRELRSRPARARAAGPVRTPPGTTPSASSRRPAGRGCARRRPSTAPRARPPPGGRPGRPPAR